MARTVQQSAIRNPLNLIFGVDSNVRVLRVLARHGGLLASSDIIQRADLSKSSTRLGLLSLEQIGIISIEGPSHNRLYRLNAEHYLADEIGSLFAAEERRFTDIIESIKTSPGDSEHLVKSLWVYGSVARGDDCLGSDLDVGIVAEASDLAKVVEVVRNNLAVNAERLGFYPSVVGLDMEDISRLSHDDDPWWINVVKDGITLVGTRPDGLGFQVGAAAYG